MPSALPQGDPPPRDGRLPSRALAAASGVPFGAYVHVPFCETRCGYCDFNTYTATEPGPGVRPGRPEAAVREARAAGFEHVNLDLIYGAPYESDDDWQTSLDAALAAAPDHISAYALVVEDGTALAWQVASGVVPAPDDDVLADR